MTAIKKLIFLVLAIAMVGLGVMFALLNKEEVQLNLIFAETPPLSVSLMVIATFVTGVLLGMFVTYLTVIKLKVKGSLKSGTSSTTAVSKA